MTYSLHKPPHCFVLPSYQWVCGQITKHLFSVSSCAEFLLWQKPLVSARVYWKKLDHLIVLITFNHSIMSVVGEEKSYGLQWKLYYYPPPGHLTRQDFVSLFAFCLFFFFFFVFDFWLIETTTGYLQGLTHSNPSKSTNQVALSNEHEKHAFWV